MTGLIILLCRNTLALSRPCLRSLLHQEPPVDILVIDNASTDGTGRYMAAEQDRRPNLYRMTFRDVVGVARCWNEGLRWAWSRGYGEALVVNADTELLPKTHLLLKEYMDLHRVGMVTAVGVANAPAYPGESLAARPHPDYSCYMLAQWAHLRVPFDEAYDGAYLEDADHHVRLYRAGIWAGSIDLGFKHHSSGTLKYADERETNRINLHYQRNKIRFLREYGCVPGTKAYEQLFLPAQGSPHAAGNAEQLEQPHH